MRVTIPELLSAKAKPGVYSIDPDETIADAAAQLSALRIGSLVVSKDGGATLVGIISERDIVRRLGEAGPKCLDMKVGDLMTKEVKTLTSDMTATQALEIMTEGRFRHMPVVEDGKVLGVITIGDCVAARLKQMEAENAAMNDMITGATF